MKKISVIIPAFNAQKFFKKCINSVVKQTLTDIEIIIINDGSSDNTLAISKQFEKKDSRIIVINKPNNEGVEKARHDGLLKASGEYVFFLDADDWLPSNTLKIMYEKSRKDQPDIVVGRVKKVIDSFGLIQKKSIFKFKKDTLLTHDIFIKKYYKAFFGINIFDVSMWAKLYNRDMLLQEIIHFLGYHMGEDLVFNLQVFPRARKILFIDDFVYYYRYGGMTTKFNKHLWPAELKMFELKKTYLKKHKLNELEKFIYIEFKNYLRTYIGMHLRFNYKYNISPALTNHINEMLHANKQILDMIVYFTHNKHEDIFVEALLNRDVKRMCEIVAENEKKLIFKRKIISTISRLLNI